MENTVKLYYEKLGEVQDVGKHLCDFYGEITGRTMTRMDKSVFNKLVLVFGRFITFFAIIDSGKTELKGDLYPYLYTICASRFEREYGGTPLPAYELLSKKNNKIMKKAEELKDVKLVAPDYTDLRSIDDSKPVQE